MKYNEIEGDLIEMAQKGAFDVIAHGCNCYCTMGAGIAPQMAKAFGCNNFTMEGEVWLGEINKLGCIDFEYVDRSDDVDNDINAKMLIVVNAYTQFGFGPNHKTGTMQPLDYEALTLCMRKMNKQFKGMEIGLPQIGAGLAGGDWEEIKAIIQRELKDCDVTIVIYNKKPTYGKQILQADNGDGK